MVTAENKLLVNTSQSAFDLIQSYIPYVTKYDRDVHNFAHVHITGNYTEKGAEDKDFQEYLETPWVIHDAQSLLVMSPLAKFKLIDSFIRRSDLPINLAYLDLLNEDNLITLKGRNSGSALAKHITYRGDGLDSSSLQTIDELLEDTTSHNSTFFKSLVFSNEKEIHYLSEDTSGKDLEKFRGLRIETPNAPTTHKNLLMHSSNGANDEIFSKLMGEALSFMSAAYEITYYLDEDLIATIVDINFSFSPEYITTSLVEDPLFKEYIDSHMILITYKEA